MLRKGQMVGSKSGNYSETAEKLVKNYQREEIFTILLEFENKKIEIQIKCSDRIDLKSTIQENIIHQGLNPISNS